LPIRNPLIIPIAVEALLVNDSVRSGGAAGAGFQRWEMQYSSLRRFSSAEPPPFSGIDVDFTAPPGTIVSPGITVSEFYNGIYLKWRLPDALRKGVDGTQPGGPRFPLVPNRWLIVRCAGADPAARQLAAWILESDAVQSPPDAPATYAQLGSMYRAADHGTAQRIGRNTQLHGQGFTEAGAPMYLTAIAPGNPAFSSYQPAHNNVFSFLDALHGEPAMAASYLVLGWYSDPSQDPLATATKETFAALLASLDLTMHSGADPGDFATTSVYCGVINSIAWQSQTAPPQSEVPEVPNIAVAIGNTSTEALTALVASQAQGKHKSVDAELLAAFLLDLLRVYDEPNGPSRLAEKMQNSCFASASGGYSWEIVDVPGADTSALTPAELAQEASWLAALNAAQKSYDASVRQSAFLRGQLFVMWWKYEYWNFAHPDCAQVNFSQADLAAQLDPTAAGSLAAQVLSAQSTCAAAQAQIPWGDTPEALQAAVAAYAQKQKLPSARALKRLHQTAFSQPTNPVLVLAGAGSQRIAADDGILRCRFAPQLVSGLHFDGATITTAQVTIPQPALGPLSGVPFTPEFVTQLMTEFFFLDPSNATRIAAQALHTSEPSTILAMAAAMAKPAQNAVGAVPDLLRLPWTKQPWRPLYLLWQANYYPIAYGSPEAPNFSFQDGGYVWNGQGGDGPNPPLLLEGRILLTTQVGASLQSRIAAFLQSSPQLDPAEFAAFQELSQFIATDDNWDFLSQALNGLNEQLAERVPGVFPTPSVASVKTCPSQAALIGDAVSYAPNLGDLPSDDQPTTTFLPWRAGQLVFFKLALVDEWGQALFLTDSHSFQHFRLTRPAELMPAPHVIGNLPEGTVQLPPGLLQPARLDFALLAADGAGGVTGRAANANPIGGWVLPNHQDRALAVYDSAGSQLGELALGIDAGDHQEVCWRAAPDSPYSKLEDLAAALPHFGTFLLQLSQLTPQNFAQVLAAIDETLWKNPPSGAVFNPSIAELVGRPLAFVRARLALALSQPPAVDPSWQFTFCPAATPMTGYKFAIELGNLNQLSDGLVGYFVEADYSRFNIVQQAGTATAGGYLRPIGENDNYLYQSFDGKTATCVSLLLDPRAAVHATTAILPVQRVALPPNFVDQALATMAITIRCGPLLADARITTGSDGASQTTLLIPHASRRQGAWSWQEAESVGWTTYPLASPDAGAHLSNNPPVLRDGFLRLSPPLSTKR
jgi:hypothetical protein